MKLDAKDRIFSLGIWTWLAIVEQERDQLSTHAQSALELLREDLEALASDVEAGS